MAGPRILPFAAGAALLAGGPACAEDAAAQVLAIETARAKAMVAVDIATLDRITDEDYVHVESSGKTRTKAQLLEGLRRGEFRFASFAVDDNRVRIYGDVAVVTGSYRNAILTPTGPGPTKNARHIRVYVRRADTWKNVSHQATAVAP